MEDRALEHIVEIFKELRTSVKNVDSGEELDKIIEHLFGYVGGKVYKKSASYNPQTVISAIEFEGEVDGYTIHEIIRVNDTQFGLNQLVEDLTMACWRVKLNRKDLNTYQLIEKIINNLDIDVDKGD